MCGGAGIGNWGRDVLVFKAELLERPEKRPALDIEVPCSFSIHSSAQSSVSRCGAWLALREWITGKPRIWKAAHRDRSCQRYSETGAYWNEGGSTSIPPILEITDRHGKLLLDAPFRVLAVMFHPDDQEARDKLVEFLSSKVVLEAARCSRVSRKMILAASERISWEPAAFERLDASAYGLGVTGELLLMIISAAIYSPRNASVKRAIRVWSEDQAQGKTGEGRKVAASPRSINAAWSRFKPVAHLCAAFQLLGNIDEDSPFLPIDSKQLLQFLAISEALRHFAEQHHPPSGRAGTQPAQVTTLDPRSTWRPPSDLVLPHVSLRVPPPTDFAMKIYSEYRTD